MKQLVLRQTFEHPVSCYSDAGPLKVIDWSIDQWTYKQDAQGTYVRVGSWMANHYFHVAAGATDKQTLRNARRHLRVKWYPEVPCTFSYEEVE